MLIFMFSVLPTGLDLSKESLPGRSYMFELRDQNSNLSIVYDAVCKEVMCIVLHRDVTVFWTRE